MAKVLKEAKNLTLEDTFKSELSYAEALIICAVLGKLNFLETREKIKDSTYINYSSTEIIPDGSRIDCELFDELKNHLKSERFVE